ncbi:uncharacterized protein LOC143217372 [Lasioglossum baleicum]|uniref:uncharacterized protein LOC143217372 n=1 Tax=Lasioglossum baleicum TaxID=434251 RepID=UPI003FCE32DF
MSQERSPEASPDSVSWLTLKDNLYSIVSDSSSTENLTTEMLSQISRTQTIENVSLLGNQLSELPPSFSESLTNLVHLDLSNNQLNDLPSSLNSLQKLVHLNIDSNKFSIIPSIVGELINLKTLTARSNWIESVPSNLGDLANLEKLDLNSNNLRDLPNSLSKLDQLKSLSLVNNQFIVIPSCIQSGMKSLLELRFSQNSRAELNVATRSVELILFCADKNGICPSFPVWLLDSKYKNLETVCLSETTFRTFNLPEFTSNIRTLRMKQCQLFSSSVKKLIRGMVNLERLVIGNSERYNENHFKYMPIHSLKKPESLKEIDVSGMEIPSVPKIISNFVNLTALNVSKNNIICLPKEICLLRNLESLILERNRLASLPKDIGKLEALRELNASHNQICELPEGLERLNGLQYMDLYDNELETMPMVLREMTGMVGLDLEQNYFSTENLMFARSSEYGSMRASLRDHWRDSYRILNGSKLKPPELVETLSESGRVYSMFSSSRWSSSVSSDFTEDSSQKDGSSCSAPDDIVNSLNNEHWDTSVDSADEFDPNENREPKIRSYPPFTFYPPFQRVFCPGDYHAPRVKTRIIKMLREGTLVWPSSYAEGQFDDA